MIASKFIKNLKFNFYIYVKIILLFFRPEILYGNNFSNIGYLQQLVFYFENNKYSTNLIDKAPSLSNNFSDRVRVLNLELFRNNNFKGYGIMDEILNMDNQLDFPRLNSCKIRIYVIKQHYKQYFICLYFLKYYKLRHESHR